MITTVDQPTSIWIPGPILGIETSCDETAASVLAADGAVLSNTGILRDDREVALGGQRGDGIHRALGFLHGVLRP